MARRYVVDGRVRTINRLVSVLTRLGIGPAESLTVTGQRSGEPRTVPVTPIEVDGTRYLVSPYGQVGWVHNLRAARRGTMSKGRRETEITVEEVTDKDEAARVLHRYASDVPITQPYFDARPEDGQAAFAAEVSTHPVFRIL